MYSILYSWLAAIVLALTACSVGVGKEQTSGDPFARLADPESSVRVAAVAEVGKTSDPRAKTALKRAIADPEHDVRLAAAKVPAEMKDSAILDELIAGLDRDDRYICRIACWQLSLIGDPSAIDPLISDILEKYDTYKDRVWESLAISRIGARLKPPVAPSVTGLAYGKWARSRPSRRCGPASGTDICVMSRRSTWKTVGCCCTAPPQREIRPCIYGVAGWKALAKFGFFRKRSPHRRTTRAAGP